MSTTCLTGITLTVQGVLHGFKDHLKVLNSSFTSTHRDVLSISICFTDPTENNVQIIDIIRPNLIHHFQENRCQRRLGSQVQTIFLTKCTMACISKAWYGRQSWRSWCCYHYQALPLGKHGSTAHVLCDDTDAFALLVHFYSAENFLHDPNQQDKGCHQHCCTWILLHTLSHSMLLWAAAWWAFGI